VLDILKENGFNNYKTVPIKDICIGSNYSCGEVSQVIINGQTQINKNELIPYDAEIVVTYHLKREIEFPYSSQKLIRRDYKNITQELFDLGFTEIHTVPLLDLTTGWLVKDGSIEKVSVGGNQTFKKTTPFEYDTEIIIEYHTFKKKR
jgi:hypothetical protein